MSINYQSVVVYGFFVEEGDIYDFQHKNGIKFYQLELPEELESSFTISLCNGGYLDSGYSGALIGVSAKKIKGLLNGETKVDFSPLVKWMNDMGIVRYNSEPDLFCEVHAG